MDFLPEGVAFNKEITYLAKVNYRNSHQVFGVKRKDQRQHTYLLGKSGSGKSALMGNMIVQNIWNGEGVCVIDPHGELVESILSTIPSHRAKDVIYFNPADEDFSVGFNVLQIDDPKYKHLVAAGLMAIFEKIWANAWSARMEYILNNAVLALADTPNSTMLGIQRMLTDKDYRQVIIGNLKDPVIKTFWLNEYETWLDQYRNEAIAPIQNKVGQFLSTSVVRNVVGQAKSTLNLFEIMNSGKILLVNISKGRIGEDNSALLGSMILTKLQLAAMERVRIPEDDRRDFYLYIDEFQNFATDAFAEILSEARKYRLNLTIAHQYISQLVTKDSEAMKEALFGNVGTFIIFRLSSADGAIFQKEFEPEFLVQDMVNLPNYHIYLKLLIDGVTSRPFSATTLPPFKIPVNSTVADEIIELSRKLYTRPKAVVEKEINEWSGMLVGLQEEGKYKAECSSCHKITMLPFEPEPGHTIYCKDCIAKIRAGELKPISESHAKTGYVVPTSALANMGIEFKPSPVDSAPTVSTPSPEETEIEAAPEDVMRSEFLDEDDDSAPTHTEQMHEPAPTFEMKSEPVFETRPEPVFTQSEASLAPVEEEVFTDFTPRSLPVTRVEEEAPVMPATAHVSNVPHDFEDEKDEPENQVPPTPTFDEEDQEEFQPYTPAPLPPIAPRENYADDDEEDEFQPEAQSSPASTAPQPKAVREVPEDILRKVLND